MHKLRTKKDWVPSQYIEDEDIEVWRRDSGDGSIYFISKLAYGKTAVLSQMEQLLGFSTRFDNIKELPLFTDKRNT